MICQPDADLLLVVPVGPAPLQALKQARHHDHGTDHTDASQSEPHGDRAHQTRQEETDGQPDERGHTHDDAQFRRRTALEDRRLHIEPVGQNVVAIGID